MSVNQNYYVIAGYDLTQFKTDKYKNWRWTEEWKQLTCSQAKGNAQFFDDPMNDSYLYFGYILANGDEYEFPTTKINLNEIVEQESNVWNKIKQLVINDVLPSEVLSQDLKYEIIAFEECT